jgi:putative ABC transport system ATP-binding protein
MIRDENRQAAAYFEDVCKSYVMGNQEVNALCDVTVSFKQGSFWAITGPSGSGKSTMLNLLGCLDRPTSGRYLLGNSDVGELGDDALSNLRLHHLGFIFQSFNLIPQLTVGENIELPLYYLGWEVTRSSERARELAVMVGLEKRLNHRPMELSGGEQQRVAIARALANDPIVLLADEPTGNLDSTTGEQIVSLLVDLNSRGKTVILVTHDPDTADIATNRMYLLDGKVERIEGGS